MKNKIIIFLMLASFSGFSQGIYRTLPMVTNTADSMKPVSIYQKAAIVQKLQTVSTVSALQSFTDATIATFDGSQWDKKVGNVASNGGSFAGTLIRVGSTVYWERKFQFPDSRFFGVVADNLTDNSVALQNYFDYCTINDYEIILPKGIVRYNSAITINAPNGLNLKGKGGSQSFLYFNSTDITKNGLTIQGASSKTYSISDFTVTTADNPSVMKKSGIELVNIQNMSIKNVTIFRYDVGLRLTDVNISNFENLKVHYCNTGVFGTNGIVTPPNLLKFTNCSFSSMIVKAIFLQLAHSVVFDNCTFEVNGTQDLANSGAFEAVVAPVNGMQGVTFNSCYFEHNGGDYDIKIQCNGSAVNSINDCTFNRIDAVNYTKYNIYLLSNPTTTAPFENSLHLSGNGFFAAGNYVPDLLRPTLKFNSNAAYQGFNIVENNNVFNSNMDSFKIPNKYKQESNNTRLLASVRMGADASIGHSYNISSVVKQSTGVYIITFANPLPHYPIISITPVGGTGIAQIANEDTYSITIVMQNLSGTFTDLGMSIAVH